MDILAQLLGIAVTVCCLISVQMKEKWQMMLFSALANLLSGINFLIFTGVVSAMFLNFLSVIITSINCYKAKADKGTHIAEKVIFLILYLVVGFMGYKELIDLLPIFAALLFMAGVFCKKEQNIRWFNVGNNVVFIIYCLITRSTNLYSQVFSLVWVLLAIYRYRERKTKTE